MSKVHDFGKPRSEPTRPQTANQDSQKHIGWLPSSQPRFKWSLELLKGALFGPKGTLTGSEGAFLSEIASERHFSLFGRNLQLQMA